MENKTALGLVALLAVAGAGVGLYAVRGRNAAPSPGLSSPAAAPEAAPTGLPALDESDPYVREKSFALSTDLSVRSWLSSDSLVARFVGALNRIAKGEIPRESLGAFGPRGKYPTTKRNGRIFADPAGGARYAAAVGAVKSIDAAAAARLFDELQPLLDAAYAALGEKGGDSRELFFSAVRELLAAPVPAGEPELKPGKKGIGWVYADEKLERLSPAQKQLMRLGPAGQKAVQEKLRAIALALGRPGSRLE
ncbi:MAG: DUF3014 domain-containing protein [Elusimicrobiota bacterium]|nr:MAG: DUF3014 domain-containing protein [Elusimicrobiota bacterium]